MATRSGTLARIRLRAAVRRQSWRKRVCPGFRFQLRVMFRKERSNFIGHGQTVST